MDRIIYNTASGPGSPEHPFQARSQVPGFRLTHQDSGRSPTTKSHHTSLCHRDWPLTSGNLFQKRQLTKHDKAPPLSPPFLLQDLRLLGIMENWDIHSMANPSVRTAVQSGLKAFKRQSGSSWTQMSFPKSLLFSFTVVITLNIFFKFDAINGYRFHNEDGGWELS